jgi:hypothetical protein
MGLKNTNYTIKGYAYPEVYAAFNGEIRKIGNDLEVAFNIHANRELALSNQPLEVKRVRVKDWDRKEDLIALAYHTGKAQKEITVWDAETHKEKIELVDNVFTGWEDDYSI